MQVEKPYFMSDSSWYRFDPDEFKYVLTDKAPQKAIDSYREFYETIEAFYGDDDE